MPLGTEVGLGPSHAVLHGDPAPLPKTGQRPQFSSDICCGQMAGWTKMPLGREVGHGPRHIVLDGDQLPSQKWVTAPQFPAHVHCGQTAGWINMLLGMKVGLGPGYIVFYGDPALPLPKRGCSPQFSSFVYCLSLGWKRVRNDLFCVEWDAKP